MIHARLAPPAMEGQARARSRFAIAVGDRGLLLIGLGLLWLLPAIFVPRLAYVTAAWDALVIAAWFVDLRRVPRASALTVSRSWPAPVALSNGSTVCLRVANGSRVAIRARLADTVPVQLVSNPADVIRVVPPAGEAEGEYAIEPSSRGRVALGDVHVRYQTLWGLAERWAIAPLEQRIAVYPNLEEARRESLRLARARQAELQRRVRAVRGAGRTFESLREYQDGDEQRDICWTASARRARLVTRRYEVERSQTIWLVIDSGRLMRTRVGDVTKLDLAVNAALTLSQVALGAGDRVGLLVYGRRIDHRLPAARGSAHLRAIIEHLTDVRADPSEADHYQAAGRLLADQTRRSLIVWLTDLPDSPMTPDVVQGAAQLTHTHLVLFMVVGQADLGRLAAAEPADVDAMYQTAAAQEVMHRRDVVLSRLRARGALAMELDAQLSPRLVSAYLEIKQRGRL